MRFLGCKYFCAWSIWTNLHTSFYVEIIVSLPIEVPIVAAVSGYLQHYDVIIHILDMFWNAKSLSIGISLYPL